MSTPNEVTLKQKMFNNHMVVADVEITLRDTQKSSDELLKIAEVYVSKLKTENVETKNKGFG